MKYYRFEPGIHEFYGIQHYPSLPQGVSFLVGRTITVSLPEPLIFEVNQPQGQAPKHFLGMQIPVMSERLLRVFSLAGVQNIQLFSAILRDGSGEEWRGYQIVNVLGLATETDRSKTGDLMVSRSADDPGAIIINEKLRELLIKEQPTEGWGITLFELK